MSEYFPELKSFRRKMKFELDLSNYATKATTTTTTTAAAALNAKINEAKGKIPNITNLATSTALTVVANKTPNVSDVVAKMTITQK